MEDNLKQTLGHVAHFYDHRKVGHVGPLGFRRSTDIKKMLLCLNRLLDANIIVPGQSNFLDLGCADGRVNVLLSYLLKTSVGIELDDWTLDEYLPLKAELGEELRSRGLLPPPENIFLFHGDSTDEAVHRTIAQKTGHAFKEFDIFYTYLVMHEEFSKLIGAKAKKGSFYLVYGLDKILPRYKGFRLLDAISPLEGILAVYQKE